MFANLLLCLVGLVITMAETALSVRQTRAVQAQQRVRAANWGTGFEAVLCLDIWLLANNRWWLIPPILLGAWLGIYFNTGKKVA